MEWTDKIRRAKIVFVLTAILIAVSSLFVSKKLTDSLKREERGRMEVWAEAMKSLSKADENTDLSLVLKVLNENDYIPVVLLDRHGKVTDFRNVSLHAANHADSLREASLLARGWMSDGHVVKVSIDDTRHDYINVCYDESLILKRLTVFPFVQLAVVLVFVALAVFALLASKRAEQNRVWAGLSKETAHQLGTPISSLMAWVEVLKEEYPYDDLIPELDKDVSRLRLISDRFSKIGSKPELTLTNLSDVLGHVVDYIDRRTSHNVVISCKLPDHEVMVNINAALFEWGDREPVQKRRGCHEWRSRHHYHHGGGDGAKGSYRRCRHGKGYQQEKHQERFPSRLHYQEAWLGPRPVARQTNNRGIS